jgi:hypothetical protein
MEEDIMKCAYPLPKPGSDSEFDLIYPPKPCDEPAEYMWKGASLCRKHVSLAIAHWGTGWS